jgi:hypothetical protein
MRILILCKQIYLYEWICNYWLADFTFEVDDAGIRIGLQHKKKTIGFGK